MKRIFQILISSTMLAIFTGFFLLNNGLIVYGLSPPSPLTTEAQVTISATIGAPILKLWGYGAPNSRVEVSGDRVSDFTYSKFNGYYEFTKIYLPQSSGILYPELCLIEIDQTGRATPPTCIPKLPANKYSYDIGPVILPPSLSLTEASVKSLTQAGANGMTIPNSEIKVVLAEDRGSGLGDLNIIKEALAYYIPNYVIKSDNQGYFSFNMPGNSSNRWHVFAITDYSKGLSSSKSNTLKFEVVSPFQYSSQGFWAFLLSLLTLPMLIILEIVVILLIVTIFFLTKRRKEKVESKTVANSIR